MSVAANSTSWTSFVKSIASYNGDLSSLTAPPFILHDVSLTEYSQYWAEHQDLLLAPNFIDATGLTSDELEIKRMVAVTKWFISTLRSQYCSRNESKGSEKKPLNPFLGEVFIGKWTDSSEDASFGESVLLSEQVSHHPPVTGYAVVNAKNNTLLQGYNGVKASFSATSLNVKQYGHALLEYQNLGAEYLVTLPQLHIEGMLVASPFVELQDKSYIQASSGYLTVVEFSGRGYLTGKKNSFKARIYKDKAASANKKNALFTIDGQWSGVSTISEGSEAKKSGALFYNATKAARNQLVVKPIEQQHDLESRKAWKDVAEAIRAGDFQTISATKSKLENAQRELRLEEKANGTVWARRWFAEVDLNDPAVRLPAAGTKADPALGLTELACLSKGNNPSGTVKGEKHDTSVEAKHWRFQPAMWEKEAEIKI
ncbi:hypothetical protein BABINDRAFT_172693 [Babjeviella inositovora NRRL Y-12698]|uniref:Oxysterol-binding protein n=1 Tax=Babjeviella inositovora NRRL Y-12698 TaxID=984486 RepID=A0A1E3QIT4_9ASCO|nr:uncharacterized protein BABINDRAFT_172693 [Babjeviella inositovora NRRL Y-12698]ODQ77609.1 hypothetical protein BABINDRAFT_172693 [Babjeviella inositovora NRRL Y-12698]